MGTTAEKNVFTFDYEVFRMRLIGFQHDHEKQESPREKYLKDFKDFKSKRKPYRKDEDKQTCGGIAVDSVLAQLEAATKTPQAFQSYMRCTA